MVRAQYPEIAGEMRNGLRDFSSVIKDNDAHIRFAFLTDVRYADKYRSDECPVHLVGVEFSRDNRNIVALEVATIQCGT